MHNIYKPLFSLDPSITFLNHGSFGACPKVVFDTLIKFQKKLEFEPVKFLAYDIYHYLKESREALAKYINCDWIRPSSTFDYAEKVNVQHFCPPYVTTAGLDPA